MARLGSPGPDEGTRGFCLSIGKEVAGHRMFGYRLRKTSPMEQTR